MKSTAVDESLSSMNQQFCSRENQLLQTNNKISFALLQIRSVLVSAEFSSPAMMLFNRPIRALLLHIGRDPISDIQ